MRELSITIAAEDGGRAVRFIALQRLSMSYAQFKRAKFQGALELDGEPVHADRLVRAGQALVIRVPEAGIRGVEPYALKLRIAYEDGDILVVDKPAPLPSVGSRIQDGLTLENAVFSYLGAPDGFLYRPVNRLDKGTSGLMAVAKHAHAQQYLQRRLHSDAFVREYLAVCDGVPPANEGVIDAPIAKADGPSIRRVVCAQGKPARTAYRVERTCGGQICERSSLLRLTKTPGMLEGSQSFDVQSETSDMCGGFGTLRSKDSLHGGLAVSAPSACEQARSANSIQRQSHCIDTPRRSLLRLRLSTGRTHQIRAHLSHIGCPVTGDFLYGTEHPLLARRFALHSALLELVTLDGKHIRLESPMPDVFEQLL